MNVENIVENIKKELYGEPVPENINNTNAQETDLNVESSKPQEAPMNLYCARRIEEYRAKKRLVIFGSGAYGTKIYSFLCNNGLRDKIVAFCDNNQDRWGAEFDGVPIMSLEETMENFPNSTYIVTPKGAENELTRQLVHQGILIDNISIFIFLIAGI